MTRSHIPFTRIHLTGRELDYIRAAVESGQLAGGGTFSRRCEQRLEEMIGCASALLTHSGTAALEMAAILADVGPGDEVIMPSFTFTSTANAFVLRGAMPVFVDIHPRTMNVDPELVAAAITPRTRAIVPVHYAGIACDMETIMEIASRAGVMIIEDAAQALRSTWRDRPLGSFGAMAALSFHQTKNVACGEAGALLINDAALVERAEIIREKGTNRSHFHRGAVDKYSWLDVGSSYLPGELIAAFLLAQLEAADDITARRIAAWERYHAALAPLEELGYLLRPVVPVGARGNAHIYYVLLPSLAQRTNVIDALRARGINAVFHYVPLHSSPAGLRFGRVAGKLPVTDDISDRLLRLPIWSDMTESDVDVVVEAIHAVVGVTARA